MASNEVSKEALDAAIKEALKDALRGTQKKAPMEVPPRIKPKPEAEHPIDLTSKIYVVTGANRGIGFAIVRALCKRNDGKVYLTARNEKRGRAAVALLEEEGLKPIFRQLNIDVPHNIKSFAEFIKTHHGGLDVLVNNAAINYKHDAKESFYQQVENTCRVNVFATMNVCNDLFPLLRPHARVVNLSSSCGFLQRIDGDPVRSFRLRQKLADPTLENHHVIQLVSDFMNYAKKNISHYSKGWPKSPYVVSKVCISAVTRIQQREFNKTRWNDDILVNHVHPGYVDTEMTDHRGLLTIDEGAEAPVWLALLPPNDPKNPMGNYVWCDKTIVAWIKGPLPWQGASEEDVTGGTGGEEKEDTDFFEIEENLDTDEEQEEASDITSAEISL